jgi:Uma2 family endonuclease
MYWTAEMVRAIPDDLNRYECIDGELLVTPSPGYLHQAMVGEFLVALHPYVQEMKLWHLTFSPVDVELAPGMIVQPDLFAFCLTPGAWDGRIYESDLILVIEVLSKATVERDRTVKRMFYERIGVPEYWIVDPFTRCVERWRPGATTPEIVRGRLSWHPEDAKAPFIFEMPACFDAAEEAFGPP